MLRAGETAAEQAIEAARQQNRWRGVWAYDREFDKLVLQLPGAYRGFWRSQPDALLVFHSPRYVRLETAVAGSELTTGAGAMEQMKRPPPVCAMPREATVALARSDEREYCVMCDEISFHIGWRDVWPRTRARKAPLAIRGQPSTTDRELRPIDQISHLAAVEGATVRWWRYSVSHQTLLFVATGLPGEPFVLRFGYTFYVDCPTTMHNVLFRLATPAEREALRPQLSRQLADRFDRDGSRFNVALCPGEGLMMIECDEGVFAIWAGVLFLSWRDRVDFSGFV